MNENGMFLANTLVEYDSKLEHTQDLVLRFYNNKLVLGVLLDYLPTHAKNC